MGFAESYKDLEVYRLSRSLSKEVFELSKRFPKEEMYSLTSDQEVVAVGWRSDRRGLGEKKVSASLYE